MSEWADHKFRSALLREAAAAIVAENDRMLWATKPGKHWAADLLARMAATSDAVVEQGALPVPTAMKLEVQSLPLRTVVELNDLRMRLAAVANPPREVFLALYDGAEPELFTTVEAARECCDDLAKTDAHDRYWDWTVNEFGTHVQFWTHPDDDRPLSETSGSVFPVVVQGDEPLSELEQLRARVAELEAERCTSNEALDDVVRELRTPYAERARRETHPGRRQAWRMLAQCEESERVANALLTPEADRSADKLTRLLAPSQALREDKPTGAGQEPDPRSCQACGSLPETWCPDCAACEKGCFGGFDGNNCTHANAQWGGA